MFTLEIVIFCMISLVTPFYRGWLKGKILKTFSKHNVWLWQTLQIQTWGLEFKTSQMQTPLSSLLHCPQYLLVHTRHSSFSGCAFGVTLPCTHGWLFTLFGMTFSILPQGNSKRSFRVQPEYLFLYGNWADRLFCSISIPFTPSTGLIHCRQSVPRPNTLHYRSCFIA